MFKDIKVAVENGWMHLYEYALSQVGFVNEVLALKKGDKT